MADPECPVLTGFCTQCAGTVVIGALRCRHCGAALQGRDRSPITRVELEGAGLRFGDPRELERDDEA